MIEFRFCNMKPLPCGCRLKLSSGRGEYSDVHIFTPCKKHSPNTDPKYDGTFDDAIFLASGEWAKRNEEGKWVEFT